MSAKMEIVNIVSTFDLQPEEKLRFEEIKKVLFDYKYDHKYKRFFFGFRKPYGSVTLYNTGKGICMGTSSLEDTRAIIRRLAYRLQKHCGYNLKYTGFKIKNIAITIRVDHEIDLYTLAKAHPRCVKFNPESFAGAVYNKKGNLKFTFFRNGKINATGFTSMKQINKSTERVVNLADTYRIGSDILHIIKSIID